MADDIVIKIKGDNSDIDKKLDKTKKKVKGVGDSAGISEKKLKGMKTALKGVATAGAAAFATLSVVAVKAIKDFAKFEDEMLGVKTLLNANSFGAKGLEQGFADMTAKVKELGASVPVDLGAMNKALFDTVSAGVDASEAVDVLKVSAQLATAGLTDVSTATDGMTSAMNAYGLGAGDAEAIASKFFAAQKAGKTTIAELSSGFGLVGASANAFGVSLDELLAATSAVTTAGIGTSQAYTGLNAVLASVSKPTAAAAKEAKRLGIEFDSTALRTKGLKGFFDDLSTSAGFNKQSIERLFGSVEAQKIMFSLTGAQADAFSGTLKNLTDKQKSLNEYTNAYTTSAAGIKNQMKLAENQVKLLSISLGEALAPQILLVTNYWTKWIKSFTNTKKASSDVRVLNEEIAVMEKRLKLAQSTGFTGFLMNIQTFGKAGIAAAARAIDLEQKLIKLKEKKISIETQKGKEDDPATAAKRKADIETQIEQETADAKAKIIAEAAALKAEKEEETALALAALKVKNKEEETKALAEAEKRQIDELNALKAEAAIAAEELRLEGLDKKQLDAEMDAQLLKSHLSAEEKIRFQAQLNTQKNDAKNKKTLLKAQIASDKEDLKRKQNFQKAQEALDASFTSQRLSLAQNTANLITTIAGKENKVAFAIAQAAALAQVAVGTGKALAMIPAQTAHIPYPANLAAAAQMATYTKINAGIQAATIAAATIQGFEKGGVVAGNSFTGDNVPVNVNSGEMILNKNQQAELFAMAKGGGTNNSPIEVILTMKDNLVDFIEVELAERQALDTGI